MRAFHVGDRRDGTEIITSQAEDAGSMGQKCVCFFIIIQIARGALADTQAAARAFCRIDTNVIAPAVEGGPERDALEQAEEVRERIEALEGFPAGKNASSEGTGMGSCPCKNGLDSGGVICECEEKTHHGNANVVRHQEMLSPSDIKAALSKVPLCGTCPVAGK